MAARALLGDGGGGWGAPGGGCGEIINMFIVGIEKMRLLYLICLTITALPLLCQHNPILPFKDYGDLLEPLEEGLVQNKANCLPVAKPGMALLQVLYVTSGKT